MSRSASGRTVRETWIEGRTCPAVVALTSVLRRGGSLGHAVASADAYAFRDIDGIPLDLFSELMFYLEETTDLAGTAPTVNVYVQRAIRPNAAPSVAGDWEDYYAFPVINTSPALKMMVQMPAIKTGSATQSGSTGYARTVQGLSVSTVEFGHWGEALRIVEVTGGTAITTGCVYNIHVTGRLERGVDPKTLLNIAGAVSLA